MDEVDVTSASGLHYGQERPEKKSKTAIEAGWDERFKTHDAQRNCYMFLCVQGCIWYFGLLVCPSGPPKVEYLTTKRIGTFRNNGTYVYLATVSNTTTSRYIC